MEEEINMASIMIDSINSIFSTLFSSVDTSLYSLLDEITFIDSDILNTPHFSSIFGTSSSNGILLIANSLVIGFLLYYAIKHLLSYFTITQEVDRPASFIFKLIIFGIFMNTSFFICERIIFFSSIIGSLIQDLGLHLFSTTISFSNLFDKIQSIIIIEQNSFNLFSIDGILKSFLSVSFINLAFSYSIRYILLKVFVLISPFAFLSLCTSSTSYFFKAWFKCFLSLLIIQILVSLILIITFSIDFNPTNTLSKFLICGAIFALLKANHLVREFIGGVSTDFSSGFSNITSMIRS